MEIEDIMEYLLCERRNIKGSKLLEEMLQNNKFKTLVAKGILENKIKPLLTEEFIEKMEQQNCRGYSSVYNIFVDGKNIGTCNATSTEISYMFNNVDLVGGINPFFEGTPASPNGVHSWLETDKELLDTSTLMIVDKSYIKSLEYNENIRFNSHNLFSNTNYQLAKEFACDRSLKRK
ncbi:MAG: hypothetical protein GX758_01270 [Tenericutes bacterium]|nr:hypothetical protein [Mycoplasmatota bacterium]